VVKANTKKNKKPTNFEYLNSLPFIITVGAVLFIWTPAFDPINISKASLVIALGLPLSLIMAYLAIKQWQKQWHWLSVSLLFLVYISFRMTDPNLTIWRKTIGTFTRSSGALVLISFVLIMMTTALLNYRKNLFLWRYTIYFISCIIIPYGILQISGNDPIEWNYQVSNKLLLTLGNPNFSSALFGILAAALLPIYFEKVMGKKQRVFALFLAICNFTLSLQTSSIQGPIAALGGLTIIFLLLPIMLQKRTIFKVMGLGSIAAATTFIIGLYIIAPTIFDRLFSYTFDLRKYYWSAAARMIQSHPFFGVGIDSYGENYRLLRGYEVTQFYNPFVYSNNAHNFLLQIGATLGLIGLILYLIIQAVIIFAIFKLILNKEKRITPTEMGLIAAWVAFQLQNMVSVDQIGVQILGWCLSGVLLSYLAEDKNLKVQAIKSRELVAYSLVFIFFFTFSISTLYKDVNLKKAMESAYDPNSAQSINDRATKIYQAAKKLQGDATYVALAAENIYQTGQRELAIKLALENVENFPRSVEALSTALVLLENDNRLSEAYELRKRMQQSDPYNWENLYILAEAAEKLNYIEEAKNFYQQVITKPSSQARKLDAQAALGRLS